MRHFGHAQIRVGNAVNFNCRAFSLSLFLLIDMGMQITTVVLDEAGAPRFNAEVQVDPISLMVLAETREDLVRSKGAEWAAGAIPFWGKQLADAAVSARPQAEIEQVAIQVAIAAWLFDSVYGGIEAELFAHSDLHFTVTPQGAVKYDRYLRS